MKKSGFTLAEVLLTLGIIGVVSSLTLPNLNMNTTTAKNKAALKSTMSILSGAAQANMSNYGWDFSGIRTTNASMYDDAKNNDTMTGLLNSNLVGKNFLDIGVRANLTTQKYSHVEPAATGGASGAFAFYQLSNGSVIGMNTNATNCTMDNYKNAHFESDKYCAGFIDVNGIAGPNKVIECVNGNTDYSHQGPLFMCEINPNTNADIFPIKFYDSTVEVATNAGFTYLYGAD